MKTGELVDVTRMTAIGWSCVPPNCADGDTHTARLVLIEKLEGGENG